MTESGELKVLVRTWTCGDGHGHAAVSDTPSEKSSGIL